MENENISFDEFEAAFGDETGNQTDFADEGTGDVTTQDPQETGDETGEEEDSGGEPDPEEQPDKEKPPAEKAEPETFTLKVNKEEKTYSREEVISLAQKGADYDRVKEQLNTSRETASQLQIQLDSQKEAMELLTDMAKESGMEMPKFLDTIRMNMLKKQGLSEEAASERLLRMKAEKENAALKANAEQLQTKETAADRATREIAEFREAYPDVQITKELVDKLMDDVHGGKSLTEAYRNLERAQTAAKIAELERQLAAQKQNAENRAASPGSQKDSGGRRTKSEYDDFMEAFS